MNQMDVLLAAAGLEQWRLAGAGSIVSQSNHGGLLLQH